MRLSARFRRCIVVAAVLSLSALLLLACSGPDSRTSTATASPDAGIPEMTQGPDATDTTSVTGTQAPASPTASSGPDMSQDEPTPASGTQPPVETAAPTNGPSTASPEPEPVTPQPPDLGTPLEYDPRAVAPSYEQVGDGFDQPVFVTHAGDGSGEIYVLEKVGTLKRLNGTMVLDIRNRVIQTGVFGYEHEQGMLGAAFHPEFSSNGYFYVHYNDLNGDHVISRYTVGGNGVADPASEIVLLAFHQPEVNFQGGMLLFGDDGYLYIGTGTGGAEVELQFLAQDLGSLYGKILRVDVDGGDPYGIPASNPFVGVDGALNEIWAYGLRNPWRFSFDRANGDLYIGGPGQFTEEWIDYQPGSTPAGENFGWPMYEGTQCWDEWVGPCDPAGLRMPILTYPTYQNGNCVVIGGYVYRGTQHEQLNGAYFFGDFCSGNVWTGWQDTGGNWRMEGVFQIPGLISSFGEDEAGELYICDIHNGVIYRITATAT